MDKILNPFSLLQGYVCCTITQKSFQADYRVLPYVSKPDAPIFTRVSFLVEEGKPGLKKIHDALVTV